MSESMMPGVGQTLWSPRTSRGLVWLGALLASVSFVWVLAQRSLVWHSQRDLELRETYNAFLHTGVLLIKAAGTGSYNVQAPAVGPWVSAAWDDDPGSYIIASLMGMITHSESPYPGLSIAVALLLALPMLWLPTTIARLFKSSRAGFALVALPLVMWLTNNGVVAAGTQYGGSDNVAVTPVYALYGLGSAFVFFSLALLLWFTTRRLSLSMLILISALFVMLAAVCNLTRSLSGMGVIIGVGILWWLNSERARKRVFVSIAAVLVMLGLTAGLGNLSMYGLNSARSSATSQSMADLPDAHGTWHPIYLGLAWPTPVTGKPSAFDVKWDDLFGWKQAQSVNPDVVIGGKEYDAILKDFYISDVTAKPLSAVKTYLEKLFYVIHHFAAMIVLIALAGLLSFFQRPSLKKPFVVGTVAVLPSLLLGLIPSVLVMPMLYYYSELTAALSILVALSLGVVGARLRFTHKATAPNDNKLV